MLIWRCNFRDSDIASFSCFGRLPVLLVILLGAHNSLAADTLWIANPAQVAYSIGALTQDARKLGLSNDSLAGTLNGMLSRAGLTARPAEFERDDGVLFLDIIVEEQTYYASLGFWRIASYPHPDGELASNFVIVWQDYSIGAHYDDPDAVNGTVMQIIERFIAAYSVANELAAPLQAATAP